MTQRSVWAIGAGQCVAWGVLYYAFGVLVVPVAQQLGVARWVITGAFSLALLISAAAAPTIGTLTDRGHGPVLVRAGGLGAAGLLTLWAVVPSVWTSYLAWSGLGLCMALVLYEPVFAMVGRAIDDTGERLRAIATITVFGGLASTIFLPFTAWLVDRLRWQGAVCVLASVLAMATIAVHRTGFGAVRLPDLPHASGPTALRAGTTDRRLAGLVAAFAASSFVSAAIATNLVPALVDRRLSPTTAAAYAGLFGVMQLPGRLLIMNGRFQLSPVQMIGTSLGLEMAGLAFLIPGASSPLVATGVSLFACGSGLATLARPYIVLVLFGTEQAGRLNGVIARAQQLARAGGPVAAAAMASSIGYGAVFAVLAGLLGAAALAGRLTGDSK